MTAATESSAIHYICNLKLQLGTASGTANAKCHRNWVRQRRIADFFPLAFGVRNAEQLCSTGRFSVETGAGALGGQLT